MADFNDSSSKKLKTNHHALDGFVSESSGSTQSQTLIIASNKTKLEATSSQMSNIKEPSTEKDPFPTKIVDKKLITSLQAELKYQVHSLWNHINLVEAYNEPLNEFKFPGVEISYSAYKNKAKDCKPSPKRCCISCCAHVTIGNGITKHHSLRVDGITENFDNGDIRNHHYVPVLEPNTFTSTIRPDKRATLDIVQKVYNFQYTLYCRICFSPVEKYGDIGKSNVALSLDHHLMSARHTMAVKQHYQIRENVSKPIDSFIQLIPVPCSVTNEVENSNPSKVFNPHMFLMNCCCRLVNCDFCSTPPYIFDSTVSSSAKFIWCRVCMVKFQTTPGTHFEDIKAHVETTRHETKVQNLFEKDGYIPWDTKLFSENRPSCPYKFSDLSQMQACPAFVCKTA